MTSAGILAPIQEDINALLAPMSSLEIGELKAATETKLRSSVHGDGEAIDVDFFEHLVKRLSVYEAKSFLREFHTELLRKRLAQLREYNDKEMQEQRKLMEAAKASSVASSSDAVGDDNDDTWEEIDDERLSGELENIGIKAASTSYSPLLMTEAQVGADSESWNIVEEEEDMRRLASDRQTVVEAMMRRLQDSGEIPMADAPSSIEASFSSTMHPDRAAAIARAPVSSRPSLALPSTGALSRSAVAQPSFDGRSGDERLWRAEASRGMGEGESGFAVEVPIPEQPYQQNDKFRPRKPRFFNRVKTGYDWNKYNQMHYDHDNPPPKHVQGYKFNVRQIAFHSSMSICFRLHNFVILFFAFSIRSSSSGSRFILSLTTSAR